MNTEENAGCPPPRDRTAHFKQTVAHRTAHRHSKWPAKLNCADVRTNDSTIFDIQFSEPFADGLTSRCRTVEDCPNDLLQRLHHSVPIQ